MSELFLSFQAAVHISVTPLQPAGCTDSDRMVCLRRSHDVQVLRIINEPTAAAIAYGLDKKVVFQARQFTQCKVSECGCMYPFDSCLACKWPGGRAVVSL